MLLVFAGSIQGMPNSNNWGSGASQLARWSREQGHTALETSRLLNEYNSGNSYKEDFHPILSTDRPNSPVSNSMMLTHYMYGLGQPLSLENLGTQQLVQDAVLKEGAFHKEEGSVQSRFQDQIIKKYKNSETDYSFDNGYDVGDEIGVWAFGSGTIEGQFEGAVEENSSGYVLHGKIKYQFSDVFEDPYDTFDLIPGSWVPNKDPYHIYGSWENQVNTFIPKDP